MADSIDTPTFSVSLPRIPMSLSNYDVNTRPESQPRPRQLIALSSTTPMREESKMAVQQLTHTPVSLAFVSPAEATNLGQLVAARPRNTLFVLPSAQCSPATVKHRVVTRLAKAINAIHHAEQVDAKRSEIRNRNNRINSYRENLDKSGSDTALAGLIEYSVHSLKRLCLLDSRFAPFAPDPATIHINVEILRDAQGFRAIASGYDLAFVTDGMLAALQDSCNAQLSNANAYYCKIGRLSNKFIKLEVKASAEITTEQ